MRQNVHFILVGFNYAFISYKCMLFLIFLLLERLYIIISSTGDVVVVITTEVVSSNPGHGKVYSIQHYVIMFVSDLRQIDGFSGYSSFLYQ